MADDITYQAPIYDPTTHYLGMNDEVIPLPTANKDYQSLRTGDWTSDYRDPRFQQYLANLRQYDPNASWSIGEQSVEGGYTNGGWKIDYSKLPKSVIGDNYEYFEPQHAGEYRDATKYWDDPNYGLITYKGNRIEKSGLMDKIMTYAPAAIMAVATMGASAPLTFAQQLAMAAPGMIGNFANGGGINLGQVAGLVGSYAGLPSWATAGLKYGGNLMGNVFADQPQGNKNMAYNPEQQDPSIQYPGGSATFDETGGGSPVGTGGPTDWGNILNTVLGGATGGAGFGGVNPATIPAILSALNQYNNSGKYMDMATKYADQMDPFGKQRGYYQDQLRASYDNPAAFLNDPGHQAIQAKQAAALSSRLASSGYLGSGKMSTDMMDFLAQSDNQFLDQERARLGGFAGAGIGPGAAAGLIETGIKGSIDSQNQALASLTQAFTRPTTNPAGGPTNGGNNSAVNQAIQAAKAAGVSPVDLVKTLVKLGMPQDDILRAIGDYTVSPVDLTNPTDSPFGPDPSMMAPGGPGAVLEDPTGNFNGGGIPSLDSIVNDSLTGAYPDYSSIPEVDWTSGYDLLFG